MGHRAWDWWTATCVATALCFVADPWLLVPVVAGALLGLSSSS